MRCENGRGEQLIFDKKEYSKKRCQELKENGLCVICGKPAVEGKTCCIKHAEYSRNYQREHNVLMRELKLCYCGRPQTRQRLLKMFVDKFAFVSQAMINVAKIILAHNIVQNNALKLSPEDVQIWASGGVLPKMDE